MRRLQNQISGNFRRPTSFRADPARVAVDTSADVQHRKTEDRLTRISMSIVWIFLFCHVWKLIPTIYEAIYSGETQVLTDWPKWLLIVNDISHTLIVFNSAVNFLIYVVLWEDWLGPVQRPPTYIPSTYPEASAYHKTLVNVLSKSVMAVKAHSDKTKNACGCADCCGAKK